MKLMRGATRSPFFIEVNNSWRLKSISVTWHSPI